jgi:hypothetical protein
VSDSVSAGNTNEGIAAIAPTIAINLMLDRVRIAHTSAARRSPSGYQYDRVDPLVPDQPDQQQCSERADPPHGGVEVTTRP